MKKNNAYPGARKIQSQTVACSFSVAAFLNLPLFSIGFTRNENTHITGTQVGFSVAEIRTSD